MKRFSVYVCKAKGSERRVCRRAGSEVGEGADGRVQCLSTSSLQHFNFNILGLFLLFSFFFHFFVKTVYTDPDPTPRFVAFDLYPFNETPGVNGLRTVNF